MALLNPFYAIILPFLFVFTLPIALFASLTTLFAFSILFLRVLTVYFELAFAVIPYYVLGLEPSSTHTYLKTYPQSQPTSPTVGRRKRRTSSSSSLSVKSLSNSGMLTPTALGQKGSTDTNSTRDYEGVGGWRLSSHSDSDNDDVLWTSHNHNLELPADHVRRHHRSSTGDYQFVNKVRTRSEARGSQSGSWSPENVMNTSRSRARTPSENRGGVVEGSGYITQPSSPNTAKSNRSSRSSGSSGSKGLTMKAREGGSCI